jgi:hypothetical protein
LLVGSFVERLNTAAETVREYTLAAAADSATLGESQSCPCYWQSAGGKRKQQLTGTIDALRHATPFRRRRNRLLRL